MADLDCLIFSRDRPMQLDACLRSLERNGPPIRKLFVLTKATRDGFRDGYLALDRETDAYLYPESSFCADALSLLESFGEHVLMLCDDAITYRKVEGDPVEAMAPDVLCMSLRMGLNTVYCHPRDWHHGLPAVTFNRPPFIAWDWHHQEGDFGYPYSLDGTIHRTASLLEWLRPGHEFITNANTMEMVVVNAIGNRADVPPLIASYPHSCQVGLPINRVNETNPNRAGLRYPMSVEDLNGRFLRGERVDLSAMDFTEITAAHQEVELVFS